jgi:hypothetical protein
MKSKRTAYILLPAVLLIWGIIAQRLWLATQPESERSKQNTAERPSAVLRKSSRRPPPLWLTYADPFQGGATTKQLSPRPSAEYARVGPSKSASSAFNLPIAPPVVPVAPAPWPDVAYRGSITNQRKGTKVVLLTIGQTDVMLRPGESQQGIKIVRIFRDSIRLAFQKEKKTYPRVSQP